MEQNRNAANLFLNPIPETPIPILMVILVSAASLLVGGFDIIPKIRGAVSGVNAWFSQAPASDYRLQNNKNQKDAVLLVQGQLSTSSTEDPHLLIWYGTKQSPSEVKIYKVTELQYLLAYEYTPLKVEVGLDSLNLQALPDFIIIPKEQFHSFRKEMMTRRMMGRFIPGLKGEYWMMMVNLSASNRPFDI